MSEEPIFTNEELVERFITLEALLHRHFQKNRPGRGPANNPHRGQGRVLSLLKLQPVITQKELSFLLDMRPQSLGELLGKLENAGFITRKPAEEDRRIMTITLTEAGKKAAEELAEPQAETSIFDHLSELEQQQFGQTMTKLIVELEKEMPKGARRGFGGHRGGPGHCDPRSMGGFEGRRRGRPHPEAPLPPDFEGHGHFPFGGPRFDGPDFDTQRPDFPQPKEED
ncbi:MarR family transcriptional regulator [Vagococcus sp. BWB3-3]|uniref:MarR family transcriptional regulator n=1 Tax=Vagococcus allomyrinae TaxID=2794353 RepID=A0A940SWC0_9ENTE|nr:MarR family transcriptional regulator [Vagococcus allomyrinae]MBP1043155.1 MarR family transcriptional regulator [Vagococcus allomyrinae]